MGSGEDASLLRYLVLATLATGAVGLPIYVGVKHAFSAATGAEAMVGIGVLLLVTSWVSARRERLSRLAREGQGIPSTLTSLIVGACQGLAALPGISRSAITTTPLLLRGHSGEEALRYSFLLDVIGLLGAGLVPLVVGHGGLRAVARVGVLPVTVMVVVSAVCSWLTIGTILRLASRLRSSVITFWIGILSIAAAVAFGLR